MIEVRVAIPDDAQEILEIYKPYISNTAFTFETVIPTLVEFRNRIETYLQKYPWLICKVDDVLAGYAYASTHRNREAYQWSCESSVYVHNHFKGKKIGKELYDLLFQILKIQGFRNVYAGVALPNDASEKLHQKCGFQKFVVYENVGYRLGNWQKVGWWKLQINDYDLKPSPPIKFLELNGKLLSTFFKKTASNISRHITGSHTG